MNIPPAVSMIAALFKDPTERGRACAIYGASGGVEDSIGFIVGGVISSKASWKWGLSPILVLNKGWLLSGISVKSSMSSRSS